MSWDHVPPKGGIELTPVEMQTVFQLMAGNKKTKKVSESQNGVKYRTICRECNELLGVKYDPVINSFALEVGQYLKSSLSLPKHIRHPVKPQRLLKSLFGHLLAAKVDCENTIFDQLARRYVLDENATLPNEIHVFYWPYPYQCSVAIREFGLFAPRGTFDEPAIFQTLKYFPVAYLCTEKSEYAGLDSFTHYRRCKIDDVVDLPINLSRIEHAYWPESPNDDDNKIFFGGQSAASATHARPRVRA